MKPIRELLGVVTAGEASGGYFVASGEYTQEAREFADKAGIRLIDGRELEKMVEEARAPQPFMDSTSRKHEREGKRAAAEVSCPNCGGAMVRRTARRGSNAGSAFWGCSSYPRCRGIRAA